MKISHNHSQILCLPPGPNERPSAGYFSPKIGSVSSLRGLNRYWRPGRRGRGRIDECGADAWGYCNYRGLGSLLAHRLFDCYIILAWRVIQLSQWVVTASVSEAAC